MSVTLKLHDDDAWQAAKALRLAAALLGRDYHKDHLPTDKQMIQSANLSGFIDCQRDDIRRFHRLAAAFETAVKANEK